MKKEGVYWLKKHVCNLIDVDFQVLWYVSGIGMTNSDKDYMTAAVSSPLKSSLYLANDVTELKKISDEILEHMCDGD